jgi:hypothetical protein
MRPMSADALIDTNVLLHSVSTSEDEANKGATARQVLAGPGWGLSVRVVQEFYVNVVQPPRCAMTHADAVAAIRLALSPSALAEAGGVEQNGHPGWRQLHVPPVFDHSPRGGTTKRPTKGKKP